MSGDYPLKYDLKVPVEFGSKTITEINYRNPKGKDIKKIKMDASGEMGIDVILDLFARISDQPPPFFDEVDVKDCLKLMGLASDFFVGGPQTG